jgi:hypothetical protein
MQAAYRSLSYCRRFTMASKLTQQSTVRMWTTDKPLIKQAREVLAKRMREQVNGDAGELMETSDDSFVLAAALRFFIREYPKH